MLYNDLEEVMERLTQLEAISSIVESAKIEEHAITDMLELFRVRWHFIENKDGKWIAELLPSNKVRIK